MITTWYYSMYLWFWKPAAYIIPIRTVVWIIAHAWGISDSYHINSQFYPLRYPQYYLYVSTAWTIILKTTEFLTLRNLKTKLKQVSIYLVTIPITCKVMGVGWGGGRVNGVYTQYLLCVWEKRSVYFENWMLCLPYNQILIPPFKSITLKICYFRFYIYI